MKTQTEFGARVEKSMRYASFTQQKLADEVTKLLKEGKTLTQQSIQHLIKKGKSSTFTTQIAHACKVDPNWLATGNGAMLNNMNNYYSSNKLLASKLDNLEYLPNNIYNNNNNNNNNLPLLSYKQVREMLTEHSYKELDDPLPLEFKTKVSGDAMLAPGGTIDTFPSGTILTVNTTNKSPKEGQFILSLIKESNTITFRQYRLSEETPFLHALNSNYKPIFKPFEVIGTISHSIYEKEY